VRAATRGRSDPGELRIDDRAIWTDAGVSAHIDDAGTNDADAEHQEDELSTRANAIRHASAV
jgi:hypothetical protein